MGSDNQLRQTYKIIILTGLVLFVVLVGYKIISSNIQENKEKAIIQEKANAVAQVAADLDKCLYQAEKNFQTKSSDWLTLYAGEIQRGEKTQPVASQEMYAQKDLDRKQADTDKQDCYKRYPQ